MQEGDKVWVLKYPIINGRHTAKRDKKATITKVYSRGSESLVDVRYEDGTKEEELYFDYIERIQ